MNKHYEYDSDLLHIAGEVVDDQLAIIKDFILQKKHLVHHLSQGKITTRVGSLRIKYSLAIKDEIEGDLIQKLSELSSIKLAASGTENPETGRYAVMGFITRKRGGEVFTVRDVANNHRVRESLVGVKKKTKALEYLLDQLVDRNFIIKTEGGYLR